jgi:hypothetical protein
MTERRPFNVYPRTSAAENMANIRAAIAEGYVSLAPGTYNVGRTATETALFEVDLGDGPLEFSGNGARIVVAGDTPDTVDIFHLTTPDTWNANSYAFRDFHIYPATDLAGGNCFHFDTGASVTYGFTNAGVMSRVNIGTKVHPGSPENYVEFGGYAVKLTNPSCNNGFAYNQFADMLVIGGFYFERLGDSVFFERLTVNTTEYVAFEIPSRVAGAGNVRFVGCTAVCQHGALVATGLLSLQLLGCNFEHSYGTAPDSGAVVHLHDCIKPTVLDTRAARVAGTANMYGLRADGCSGLTVANCLLGGAGAPYSDLIVTSECTNTYAPQASQYLYNNEYSVAGTTRASI